jgi:hypothetical protein
MAESTLNITFTELRTEIGRFLGLDRSYANWSADEILDVTACIKRGLRNFYFPPRTDNAQAAHRWNFLRPRSTLVIWPDVVAADAKTISTAVYASPNTTITTTTAAFYPSMEGKSLVCATSGNSYTIVSYTSSTVVVVSGDAHLETGVITIDSNDSFTLPWDFGGMSGEGNFVYDRDSNKLEVITVTSEQQIRRLRQNDITAGTPYCAAIVPKTMAGTSGQRWEVMFHNPPDTVLTLHYRYYILPDALVLTTLEYPYGSAAHSETILESCLAVAESREKEGGTGEHQARFGGLLVSSIDHDKGLGEAIIHYGYNGDYSDETHNMVNEHDLFDGTATFNGA